MDATERIIKIVEGLEMRKYLKTLNNSPLSTEIQDCADDDITFLLEYIQHLSKAVAQ